MYEALLAMDKPHVRDPYEEQTDGELEDHVDCMPSFFPYGKAGGLQIWRCQGLAVD